MVRSRRMESGTGVYHVVSRGNDQTDILLNDEDKKYFFSLMKKEIEKLSVKIYAYCIMANHYHLLLKADLKVLSLFMQELNSKYAVYYNCKYKHTGHAFQGRFFSSIVEDNAYLFSCIRYIHNNPVKVNLVSDILKYTFSSAKDYVDYLEKRKKTKGIVSEEIFCIIKERFNNKKEFLMFHALFDNQDFIDIHQEKEEYDFQRVKYYTNDYLNKHGINNYKILQDIPFLRIKFVKECSKELGMSMRKIESFLKILTKSA